MLASYIKTAFRNLVKNKALAVINVVGLGVGLCCVILIALYVADELAFDRFHAQGRSIFSVLAAFRHEDGSLGERGPAVPVGVAPLLKEAFPQIRDAVRFVNRTGTVRSERFLANEVVTFADPEVFEVFTFPLRSGDPRSCLADETRVVLTEKAAARFFEEENPVGQRLTVTFGDNRRDFVVSGVARDVPRNSTIRFGILVPIGNLPMASRPGAMTDLGDFENPLYIRLRDGASRAGVESRLEAFVSQAFAAEFAKWGDDGSAKTKRNPVSFELQALGDMHFDTGSFDGKDPGNVLILAGIALAVLLIASINFVNLSIGRAAGRTVEVGVRKAIGATRRQVLVQFWSESLLMITGALAAGLALAALVLPSFNLLSGKVLALGDFFSVQAVLILLGLLVAVAAASGSYPAAVMSRVQPAEALKGRFGAGGRRTGRGGPAKWLVIVQFSLSVFLLLLTTLLGRQVRYMTGRDTGFAKEGLVRISLQTETDEQAFLLLDRFKAQAGQYPGIASIGAANNSFGRGSGRFPLDLGGKKVNVFHYRVDPGYVETIGLTIVRGRNFEKDRGADKNGVIVNEAFCRLLGLTDPVGRTIGDLIHAPTNGYPNRLLVIGVVRDYNFLSMREELQPVLLHAQKDWGLDNLYVRVRAAGVAGTMAFLEKIWRELRPDKPFSYTFVEDDVESQYASEKRWNAIIRVSSAFALVIACMGVFGLTLLAVNRRVKEIGIRKVLGAGTGRIIGLVTGEFLALAAAANVVAWPAAYFVIRGVLNDYAYRIRPTVFDFLLAGALATVVALGTTLSLALKAAQADPIASIRYE